MNDPIVEEVRQHRLRHTKQFNGDLVSICADLQAIQKVSGHRVVRLSPRKTKTKVPAAKDGEART